MFRSRKSPHITLSSCCMKGTLFTVPTRSICHMQQTGCNINGAWVQNLNIFLQQTLLLCTKLCQNVLVRQAAQCGSATKPPRKSADMQVETPSTVVRWQHHIHRTESDNRFCHADGAALPAASALAADRRTGSKECPFLFESI